MKLENFRIYIRPKITKIRLRIKVKLVASGKAEKLL